MLIKTPKLGDEVLIVQKHGKGDRRVGLYPIEKVGRQYLTVTIYRPVKFGFDGQSAYYEMFESQEAYEKSLQRDRNITKIKREVELRSFGDGLSDETLEKILELIEGKQP